eukprot:5299839-Pleurochrysis_carterae.AAC.4
MSKPHLTKSRYVGHARRRRSMPIDVLADPLGSFDMIDGLPLKQRGGYRQRSRAERSGVPDRMHIVSHRTAGGTGAYVAGARFAVKWQVSTLEEARSLEDL